MKLALIYSGGTIGCAGTPLKPLPSKEFQELWRRHAWPRIGRDQEIQWHWLEPPLDSSDMTPADWLRIARMTLGAGEGQAVLLLHGTDTMAWTAAALALLLTEYDFVGKPMARFRFPVVITGSQRPLFEADGLRAGTDALGNLRTAVRACRDGRPGVIVAFGGEALPGARVMKMSTTADRAFECPKGTVPIPALPPAEPGALERQIDLIESGFGTKTVIAMTPTPAPAAAVRDQLAAVTAALGEKLGAIYLNGYGIGNFPARDVIAPLLQSAHDQGVLVVAGSQVPHGDVDPSTYSAGHWLGECGAISARDMTPAAVHAKLHLALAMGAVHGWVRSEMERFFLTPVAGERRA